MTLKRIRLELARDPDYPNGSHERGYDAIAPLDGEGRLLAAEWREHRDRCRVRRFWPGQADEIGHVVHKSGGEGGATWVFDYDPKSDRDDEPGFKLDQHRLAPGDYISITEHDGVRRTFFIKSVVDLD